MKFMFKLESKFTPAGDQPQAIESLVNGLKQGKKIKSYLGQQVLENLYDSKCN